jgi:hypothetical protein
MAGAETLRVDGPFTLDTACEVPLADWRRWSDAERAREGARIAERSRSPSASARGAAVARMEARRADRARNQPDDGQTVGRRRASCAPVRRARVLSSATPGSRHRRRRRRWDPPANSQGAAGRGADLPAWNYPLLTAVTWSCRGVG